MSNVVAPVTGTVWRVLVAAGDAVAKGDQLVILESMKMEIPVDATEAGTVAKVHVDEGTSVTSGQTLVVIDV